MAVYEIFFKKSVEKDFKAIPKNDLVVPSTWLRQCPGLMRRRHGSGDHGLLGHGTLIGESPGLFM